MKSVVGPDELVTPEHIHQMTLLRNCVKETLRLRLFCTCNVFDLQLLFNWHWGNLRLRSINFVSLVELATVSLAPLLFCLF